MSFAESVETSPKLIDKRELATLLGLSPTSVDRLRASGELGPLPLRVGGALRWNRDEVRQWMAHPNGDKLFSAKDWSTVKKQLNKTH